MGGILTQVVKVDFSRGFCRNQVMCFLFFLAMARRTFESNLKHYWLVVTKAFTQIGQRHKSFLCFHFGTVRPLKNSLSIIERVNILSLMRGADVNFSYRVFSRRFSREKCPTITVASFFFVRLQSHSDWTTFLTIETTSIRGQVRSAEISAKRVPPFIFYLFYVTYKTGRDQRVPP